jgi:hypothetical protein
VRYSERRLEPPSSGTARSSNRADLRASIAREDAMEKEVARSDEKQERRPTRCLAVFARISGLGPSNS